MLQTCCYRSGQSRLGLIGELSIRLYFVVLGALEVLYQEASCAREELAPRPLRTSASWFFGATINCLAIPRGTARFVCQGRRDPTLAKKLADLVYERRF